MMSKSSRHPSLVVLVAVILLAALAGFAPGSNSSGASKDHDGYTIASLKGTWSYTITGGANLASAVGIADIDEFGNSTGPFVMNAPDGSGGRMVVPGTASMTITLMNTNGTGIMSGTTTLGNPLTIDFVVTQATEHGGLKVATEMFGVQREATFGIFWMYLFKRLPD